MVDVSAKATSERRAVASGKLLMSAELVAAILAKRIPKGDPFETARIAGILAAKQTANLIPLCHSLPLSHVDVEIAVEDYGVSILATAATTAQTGVEMEALTAVTVAALTVYDMCKAIDKTITITEIRLERKTGGKSGDWQRSKEVPNTRTCSNLQQ